MNDSQLFKRIDTLYQRLADLKLVVISGTISLLLLIAFMSRAMLPSLLLAWQQLSPVGDVSGLLRQWLANDVQVYKTGIIVDTTFAIAYAVFLASFIAWLTVVPHQKPSRVLLTFFVLPLVTALFGFGENMLRLFLLTTNLPHPFLALVIEGLTLIAILIKWGFIVVILYYIFKKIGTQMTKTSHQPAS